MAHPHILILYVADPLASAAFYEKLLGQAPVDLAPTFSMFALPSGVMLGLWAKGHVLPPAVLAGGGAELAFTVGSAAEVDATCAAWRSLGVAIAQTPAAMDFGYTFTALDPDLHRLRVFAPAP